MRYKITIEYDGTYYNGWQEQDNLPTIQNSLKKALFKFTGKNIEVFGSGRTDTGVHALNQVAHFNLEKNYEPFKIIQALNFYLREGCLERVEKYKKIINNSKINDCQNFINFYFQNIQDIVIKNCEIINENFDARFSAKIRHYKYLIHNLYSPSAILQNRVWWIKQKLDLEKMNEACKYLIGKKDFSSFRCSECQAKSPIKTILSCNFSNENNLIVFKISAKSFMHHMVRNIVGTLKDVGTGKINIEKFEEIIELKDRKFAGTTAPACGLYFDFVEY